MALYVLPIFLPLIGAAIAGIFGRGLSDRQAQIVTCVLMGASAALSIVIFDPFFGSLICSNFIIALYNSFLWAALYIKRKIRLI